MGAVLGQHDESGRRERAIYYLSKKFNDCEARYSMIEKVCLSLIWATQKLRHYMMAYPVLLLCRHDPMKYLFQKPALVGRCIKWQVLLSQYDITFVTQKSMKGQAIVDHLANLPLPSYQPLQT